MLEVWIAGLEVFLLGWAALYTQQGKLHQAARLMGAIDKIYQRTKMVLSPRERDENAEALAATRAALGEEAFAARLGGRAVDDAGSGSRVCTEYNLITPSPARRIIS